MKKISLDKAGICAYQQNREPYLLIDFATEVIPGKSAKGYKILKSDQWFFKVHWPGDPNMPGMLQVEAMVQMSSLIILTMPKMSGGTLYLADSNNIKFFTKIPADGLAFLISDISDTFLLLLIASLKFKKVSIVLILSSRKLKELSFLIIFKVSFFS
jgi:3-hydroxymyristoyl/3-hydroxydecanoyl-(acyl carrier protein) dehydratase